jgi:hypothetical protein
MNPSAIPAELRALKQWVIWRIEERDGKPTKVPYQAAYPRRRAKPDEQSTWGDFETALSAALDADGIGYVFAADDPFTGVDLDACVDLQTGEIHPAAAEILHLLNSYQERSPSGTGMHVIVMGKLRGSRRRTSKTPWGHEFECYDQGRYFTITGQGGGEIAQRQEQLDELVARMFDGESSPNGAGPARRVKPMRRQRSSGPRSSTDAEAILAVHDELARIAARKGKPPKGGTPSDWDFMLGARAAELGYGDAALEALIRHARSMHGEDKGERADYVERTVAAVRAKVGRAAPDVRHQEALDELTRALRLDEVGRRVVRTFVAGHGHAAAASIELDDGYSIDFDRFEQVAQPDKLANQLACTVGITTVFTKLQARRVASLVRSIAGRGEELREHALFVDEALRLLDLAPTVGFDCDSQAERWKMWQQLRAIDPEEPPPPPAEHETSAERQRRESRSVEAYVRRMLILRDRRSGDRYVPAGWLQQFMRLRLGAGTTPSRTKQAMLRAGWRMRGDTGRIKAREPAGGGGELILAFYLVPAGWQTRQGPGDGW